MKATLEFNLPEDQESFRMASNAARFYVALFDINEHIHKAVKHGAWHDYASGSVKLTAEQLELLELVEAFVCDRLNACGFHDVEG